MSQVIFDKLSVTVEAAGVRLRLEGLVPPELWPDLNEGSQPKSRLRALALVSEAFPALIPRPILQQIEREGLAPLECASEAHNDGNSRTLAPSAALRLQASDDATGEQPIQSSI